MHQENGDELQMKYTPPYYTLLFDCVTEAIKALREQDYIKALNTLILAQRDAEEVYRDEEGEDVYDEDSPPFAWELVRVNEETRMLKIKFFLHDDNETFRKLEQGKKLRPEDPDCEEAETE